MLVDTFFGRSIYSFSSTGIECPEVIYLKENVLVMSLVGEDDKPANTLKESVLNEEERILAYTQITKVNQHFILNLFFSKLSINLSYGDSFNVI